MIQVIAIFALGINHKTAPVALREQVAFAPEQVSQALRELTTATSISDAVILSTCNRTELYFNGSASQAEQVIVWLAQFHAVDGSELQQHLYLHQDNAAAEHLMQVASGLDSLVLGEPQILGQVKQAYNQARNAGTVNPQFERLFQKTFAVAKQVRTDTEIGANAVSVAFAAVSLAKQIFGNLSKVRVLLIGAGETIELVAKHLQEQGAGALVVANRTYERAVLLAEQFDAAAITLAQVPAKLAEADIVISSTASTLPIVGKGMVEQALKRRKHKPMFLVDLAVPRDIEQQVAELEDAYLYTVDDLQTIVEQNLSNRQQAADQARLMIRAGVAEFAQWLTLQGSVDWVRDYRQRCEDIRAELLAKAVNQLSAGQDAEKVLAEMSTKLSNRLMHSPTKAIRQLGQDDELNKQTMINTLLDL
ncbi:glutamyl-tRNA reductase [Rheinheimera baltica]|uniref:Glutamyl-tRNA reductase n=2 Tax=Rheinheimera baltica TaxID=67576 RepID=A0ABT9HZ65_9GAMM|nr:glutamyl-tRNA reductase [Rheinheimera baltica]MDP5136420.1 glutamyl-tRNA reductase [Rheinheimera baltica]MDP5151690.1 glutamyl-tRNA reductase [Rheinheimera baltica]